MNILCNLPLECFESRAAFSQRIVTFGPAQRMWVDGKFYPFDIAFDASQESADDLLKRLPADFAPDLILFYWPDQEPIPTGLQHCDVPVVGVISDYNLSLPYIAGLWPFFDSVLVDRSGVDLLRRMSFHDVRPFCQFSFKPNHRIHEGVARDIDVGFVGNLNPVVQQERAKWIERVQRLTERGIHSDVRSGIIGDDYGRLLNRYRIGFNRSIRGEMNLRAFEVPACGALLFMESSNLEVRDFLEPGREVVLYDDDDFEDLVQEFLADEPRRAAMAAAGHERIRQHSMSSRIAELERMHQGLRRQRPSADEFACALGRGVAMLGTWVDPRHTARELLDAVRMRPADPRPHNALALAMLRCGTTAARRAVDLLAKACSLSPTYVPAALNLTQILEFSGDQHGAKVCREDLEHRIAHLSDWVDLDGPVLPLGYSERAVNVARGLREAVTAGAFAGHATAWLP